MTRFEPANHALEIASTLPSVGCAIVMTWIGEVVRHEVATGG